VLNFGAKLTKTHIAEYEIYQVLEVDNYPKTKKADNFLSAFLFCIY